jgi:hypothetical protein
MTRKLITAFEKIIIRHQLGMIDPVTNRISRLLGDLKLNRLPRLLLHYHSSSGYGRTMRNISHSNLDEITASQLAVDGKIEKCQVTDLMGDLKPNADCPDFLQLEWWLLAYQLTFVPGPLDFYVIQKLHFDSFASWSESNYDFYILQSRPSRS